MAQALAQSPTSQTSLCSLRKLMPTSLFMIGKNKRGQWVVQDQKGLYGGLFTGRLDALRFALFENGHRPHAVVMVPGVFELDLRGRTPQAA